MNRWSLCLGAAALALLTGTAGAVELAPYRALYSVSLSSTKPDSGVVGVDGEMAVEEGEACDGWTVEQHFQFTVHNAESDDAEIASNFVSWEAKDGLRFRFSERDLKNGAPEKDVSGEATLDGAGKGGKVDFTKPHRATLDLPAGVIFPTSHTRLLIAEAAKGEHFVARKVFDGTSEDNASDVTAVMGAPQDAAATAAGEEVKSPLLERPSWHVHLAFFSSDSNRDFPDFELGMRLLDNGISRDLVLDYGDFAVRAKLKEIEAMPKPNC